MVLSCVLCGMLHRMCIHMSPSLQLRSVRHDLHEGAPVCRVHETKRKGIWLRSFTRVGCIILLLHDVCDVFMEAAKMNKYCRQEVRQPISSQQIASSSHFVCLDCQLTHSTYMEVPPAGSRHPCHQPDPATVVSQLASSIIFGLFMLTWIALRLVYFPFWIIWSTR